MNIETERKFLVLNDDYQAQAVKSYRIRQGYLAHDSGRSVRVRIRDDQGFLTIKGPSIILGSRPEWEKEISLQEAEDLFALCKPGCVDKTRWLRGPVKPGMTGKSSWPTPIGHPVISKWTNSTGRMKGW